MQLDMSPHPCDRIGAMTESESLKAHYMKKTDTVQVEQCADDPTCLSFMRVSLSLLTATSHTQTTPLLPAVMTVVGLGQAAQYVSPQSHKFSLTAKF